MDNLKQIGDDLLVDFPRTKHLPYQPNAARDDLIASEEEASVIFAGDNMFSNVSVHVSEKMDGASIGVMLMGDIVYIRNRNHVLNKGYVARTPAGQQFSSAWGYFYKNSHWLEALNKRFSEPVALYGEWLYAVHSITYDKLPVPFLGYNIYIPSKKYFFDREITQLVFVEIGIPTPFWYENYYDYNEYAELLQEESYYGNQRIEGLYFQVSDGEKVTHRFKMVRPDFVAGEHWSNKQIVYQPAIKLG